MTELNSGTDLVPSARREGNAVVAAIHGEIDLHNSPELRDAMISVLLVGDPKKLILDLADVPYMDSSALAVLVEALKRMQRNGGRVFLFNLQPRVKGLLEIARLDTIFIVVKDAKEAIDR
jgi:anti-anti-sigma factor